MERQEFGSEKKIDRRFVSMLFVSVLCLFVVGIFDVYADELASHINTREKNEIKYHPYEEEFEHIKAKWPYNLTLTFNDIVLPGNGGLDIVVERTYSTLGDPTRDKTGEFWEPATAELLGKSANNTNSLSVAPSWDITIPTVFLRTTTAQTLPTYSQKNGCQYVSQPNLVAGFNTEISLYFPENGTRAVKTLHNVKLSESTNYSEMTIDNWKAECITSIADGGSGRVVYSPDGRRYVFSYNPTARLGTWFLTKVMDRNGNWLSYNYASYTQTDYYKQPLLLSITANDGRSVQFNYSVVSGRYVVTSIVAGSQSVAYGYESYEVYSSYNTTERRPRLKSVTLADGSQWVYGYTGTSSSGGGGYQLSSVTTPSGGVITYDLDLAFEGLKSKQTSGTLPSSTWQFPSMPGNLNRISGPGFCFDSIYLSGADGSWTESLPSSNKYYSDSSCSNAIRTETFQWDKRVVLALTPIRLCDFLNNPPCWNAEPQVYAPILTSHTITQDGQTYTTNNTSFDAYGNPLTTAESGPNGGSRTTTRTYYINTGKWIVQQLQNESFPGSSTARTFDVNGNLISVTSDGIANQLTYDSQGNVASVTNPRGHVTSFSNYKRGIAQTETQPEATTISRVVSDDGMVLSETNGDVYTTSYSYDALGRLTGTAYPVGAPKTITYTATSKTATRGNLIETTRYDGVGRPTSISLGGITTTYGYNAFGLRSFVSDPGSGAGTTYQYDALGRVTKITNADATFSTVAYGPGARSVTDERGKTTTYNYRSYGDPSQQWLMGIAAADSSANVSIARNGRDLVTSVIQAGVTRTYGYNANYYLSSVTNPETGTTTYGRDAAGNMISRTVGASGTTAFNYDGQNRLTQVTYPGTTPAVTNAYNKRGKLVSATSSVAAHSYAYDANGNMTSDSLVIDGSTFTTGYAYTNIDQLSSVTYPRSGAVVNYSPDALGRPTQVSGYINGVNYWPSGQIQQINYANGTTTNYGQNSRLWPSSFAVQKGSTYYLNSAYAYDGKGNLTGISDTADGSYNRTIGYDNLSRLTSISGPWGNGNIGYNGAGNITSQVFGSWGLIYSYDAANRMSAVSGDRTANYTYDVYGNIINDTINTYAYNDAFDLTCVNCAGGNSIAYSYDGTNHRASVTKGGVKTYEIYDPKGKLLIEFTPSQSNKLVEYIYLGGKRIAQRVSP